MGLVSCFQIAGCRCWFYSRDHLEPHFHAKASGEWEARVFFLEDPVRIEVKFSVKKNPPQVRIRELQRLAGDHRADLLVEWSEKVRVE